jgi:lipopolysaccharide transport system ATP-binding protein
MFSNIAIEVKDLSKCYQIYSKPQDRLKQTLWRGRKKFYKEFWALKKVSFTVEKGEFFGIIGRNGSGKSTLLKILSKTVFPNGGEFSINGRVAALLELGGGFDPEFTGRENIIFNGTLSGMTEKEVADRQENIIAFADIGEYIDQPVKFYSSGMFARLAFAVAAHLDPEVLIVDEILAVGDILFQQKCIRRFEELKKSGCAILFVTHSLQQIQTFCDRAMLMDEGNAILISDPKSVTEKYHQITSSMNNLNKAESSPQENEGFAPSNQKNIPEVASGFPSEEKIKTFRQSIKCNSMGTGQVEVVGVEVFPLEGDTNILYTLSPVEVNVYLIAKVAVKNLICGVTIIDSKGQNLYGTNNWSEGLNLSDVKVGEELQIKFNFTNHFAPGFYTITIGVAGEKGVTAQEYYHWIDSSVDFEVFKGHEPTHIYGLFHIPTEISLKRF